MGLDLSKSVLVVDDSNTMVRLVCGMLRQLGFEDVDFAHGGTTALAKVKAKNYGLMISDWHMEPVSGFDLLWQLRADPRFDEMRFIMMTTEAWTKTVIKARVAGANNFILKPFDVLSLKAKIEAVLAEKPNPAMAY